MLVIQHGTVANLANTFSIKVTGMGDRFLQFRGADSLDVQLVFANKQEATDALDLITGAEEEGKYCLYIDEALKEAKAGRSALE